MSYFDRLRTLSAERNTLVCVGLDPDPERIEGGAAGALRHCREVIRQTEEHACCFKPNSAFWEQYGPDGWTALLELRDEAPETPFLFDGKRGDMGNTMRAYALTAFVTLAMDAATINPYLGRDAVELLLRGRLADGRRAARALKVRPGRDARAVVEDLFDWAPPAPR